MEPLASNKVREQLQAVLHALDAIRPEAASKPLQALAEPTQLLIRVRNEVIAARRTGELAEPPALLQRLNQLASVMASLEYPLGGVHWPRIEAVRKELGALTRAMDRD